jgi:N-methylhydantoinase A/oxoprolinase/acetone carboxylase beta subunit
MQGSFRIGVDIGGTFTDFTVVDDNSGEVLVEKCLTSPDQPEVAVMQGLRSLAERQPGLLENAQSVIHATTLLTNILLERKGSKTGLLTTEGFRDVLEFGRELRYDVYDPFITFRTPIVPRELRIGIPERVLVNGDVLEPLDETALRKAAEGFREAGVGAVAICFLHSYLRPEHEIRAAQILREMLPDIEISISSEVHPEPKEYERTSTTVVDAYVKPTAAKYLDELAEELHSFGYKNKLLVMLSNGGAATAATTKKFPVQAVESGPAAGVEAAMHYGKMLDMPKLLSFDMGGTTAKLCVVLDGRAARTRDFEVDRVQRFKPGSGIPIATPVYDLLELGAGGGSIARVNELGLLAVGPESAGSKPGPACYGLGGEDPTVTDANVVLGFIGDKSFMGGAMPLDGQAASDAIERKVAGQMSLSVAGAAWGIHNFVNETMASAARVYIAEKGQNPRDLGLVAFGGAGPVHAVGVARKLGCRKVVIPPLPGVMSSFGLLAAPVAIERPRSIGLPLPELTPEQLETITNELKEEARSYLPEGANVQFEYIADICRIGQAYPLEINIDWNWTDTDSFERLQAAFEEQYAAHYGRVDDTTWLELVTLRVKAGQPVSPPKVKPDSTREDNIAETMRDIYSPVSGRYERSRVVKRASLRPGDSVKGPAVIEERESSTVIGAGDVLSVDALGCLVIEISE